MTDTLTKQLQFLIEVDKMKNIFRQTLVMDKSRRENDAEHSWHFALMALTLFEYAGFDGVDIHRVIKMALLHDLVEIYAGDTFAYDSAGNLDKPRREKEAADKLFSMLPPGQAMEYRRLWEEFDAMNTPDSMYASAVDRLQPFISNYKTDGHTWVRHKVSVEQIYARMAPVKDALPALWEFVEFVVRDSLEKGYILPASKPLNEITDSERARLFPIIISEYNPAWPQWFAKEKEILLRLIGADNITRINHFGSTSVPGLAAKPTVDILLEIREGIEPNTLVKILPYPEYIPQERDFPEEKLMFYKGYTPTGFADEVYHIHVRRPGDKPRGGEWDELVFRDYLLAHPETAAEYAALKCRLKDAFEYDRDGYTDAKGGFIRTITEKARKEAE